jgi:hypothetical protein
MRQSSDNHQRQQIGPLDTSIRHPRHAQYDQFNR